MKRKTKKKSRKKFHLPAPEKLFNKKTILLAMIFLAIFFNLLIISYTKFILSLKEENPKFPSPLERDIKKLITGYPMEEMTPYIKLKEKGVAAFLIGIAKKESNWGKHSPKKDGRECYNYWGYRGKENTTDSGYSCFDSPEHAVAVVGGRIEDLINQRIDTPEKMIVWKCGKSCEGHSEQSVSKWISDVGYYYEKVYQ